MIDGDAMLDGTAAAAGSQRLFCSSGVLPPVPSVAGCWKENRPAVVDSHIPRQCRARLLFWQAESDLLWLCGKT